MSAGRDGVINQDCRGEKIGGWGSGRVEQASIYRYINPFDVFNIPNDLRKCSDQQITEMVSN